MNVVEVWHMNTYILAPCGVVCELCIGYQRKNNKCGGCHRSGNKPNRCDTCSIKNCSEKTDEKELCIDCGKFPCRRIKNLDKRYLTKYAESPIQNMQIVKNQGIRFFTKTIKETWTCKKCGNLLSVHRDRCTVCGEENPHFPVKPGQL